LLKGNCWRKDACVYLHIDKCAEKKDDENESVEDSEKEDVDCNDEEDIIEEIVDENEQIRMTTIMGMLQIILLET
jgi:hypothetical protein